DRNVTGVQTCALPISTPRLPLISEGASGLGSKESRCVTPPAIHRTMTDLAVAASGLTEEAAWAPGSRAPATPSEATRSRSRRLTDRKSVVEGKGGEGG